MAKEFIPIFLDFNETTQDLTDEQCGRLVRALVDYTNGKEYRLEGVEMIAFRFLKGSIDRNEKLSTIRAEAGSKGGKQTQANASKKKQEKANASKRKQNCINNDNKANNENDNENDNLFARFWSAYPRHVSKQNAEKAFEKLDVDEELLQTILSAIEKQKNCEQWTKDGGQFIPHPATWLNGHRWEDEVVTISPKADVHAQQYTQRGYEDEDNAAMKRMLQLVRDGT